MVDFQVLEMKQQQASFLHRRRKLLVLGSLICLSGLLLGLGLDGRFRTAEGHAYAPLQMDGSKPVPALTVLLPPTVSARDAAVPDDARVIGIEIGGRHRAYCISALAANPCLHVVEDRIGHSPVCVTYCPLEGCTKVFARDTGPLLEVTLGGLSRPYHHLLLRVGSARYDQTTLMPLDGSGSPFPYSCYPYLVTTWGQWRAEHPDTDAYAGL